MGDGTPETAIDTPTLEGCALDPTADLRRQASASDPRGVARTAAGRRSLSAG